MVELQGIKHSTQNCYEIYNESSLVLTVRNQPSLFFLLCSSSLTEEKTKELASAQIQSQFTTIISELSRAEWNNLLSFAFAFIMIKKLFYLLSTSLSKHSFSSWSAHQAQYGGVPNSWEPKEPSDPFWPSTKAFCILQTNILLLMQLPEWLFASDICSHVHLTWIKASGI